MRKSESKLWLSGLGLGDPRPLVAEGRGLDGRDLGGGVDGRAHGGVTDLGGRRDLLLRRGRGLEVSREQELQGQALELRVRGADASDGVPPPVRSPGGEGVEVDQLLPPLRTVSPLTPLERQGRPRLDAVHGDRRTRGCRAPLAVLSTGV